MKNDRIFVNVPEIGGPLGSWGPRKSKDLSIVCIIVHLDRKAVLSIFRSTKCWARQIQFKSIHGKHIHNIKLPTSDANYLQCSLLLLAFSAWALKWKGIRVTAASLAILQASSHSCNNNVTKSQSQWKCDISNLLSSQLDPWCKTAAWVLALWCVKAVKFTFITLS